MTIRRALRRVSTDTTVDGVPLLNAHQRYLIEEFAEDYHDHRLARRDLLKRVLLITGSIPATAAVLLELGCGGGDADAKKTPTAVGGGTSTPQQTPTTATSTTAVSATARPQDVASGRDVTFKGQAGDVFGYLARPSNQAPGSTNPGVIVIHENRGLVDHIKDVTRRYADAGFVALAVDLLSRSGGTATTDANTAPGALGRANIPDLVADLQSGVSYLLEQPGVRKAGIGLTGFCFGGNYTWELAIASQQIVAAVPYYGMVRNFDDLAKTRAAVLAIYGGNDTRITAQSDTVKQKLTEAGRPVEIKVYPGADHAFFNDTGTRYNAAAAQDAWKLTLDWFRKYLPAS